MCTINQDHMMYGSWDIKCKGQSFLSFWAIFLPFDPPNKPKNQNPKKCLEILSFYTCVLQMTIMMYGSWYIKHDRQNFFVVLSHFWKNEKSSWRYYHFTQVYHKWQSYDIWFLRYQLQQTDFFCHLGAFFALLPP